MGLMRSLVNAQLDLTNGETKLVESGRNYEILKVVSNDNTYDITFKDGSIAAGLDMQAFEFYNVQIESKPKIFKFNNQFGIPVSG
jgi:hypothetical protein